MSEKLSEAQLAFLARVEKKKLVRTDADKVTLFDAMWRDPPLVMNVYEWFAGAFTAELTPAGRAALDAKAEG